MNLRHLELFISLAGTPHVATVAKKHFVSQGAVSVAIKGLEEELGVPLFDRLNRRLALNSNGREFLTQLEPVMDRLGEVLRIFEGDHMTGALVVGASSTIADYILPQLLFEFGEKYPQVHIENVFANPREVVEGVRAGRIDFGLTEDEIKTRGVEAYRLCRDELFVVSSDEQFASGGPYPFEALVKKKWILREQEAGSRVTFDRHAGQYEGELNLVLELRHTESVKRVLQNPDTISCLSPFSVQRELDSGELFHVHVSDVTFDRHLYAVVHCDKYRTRVMEKLFHAVKSYLGTDRMLYEEE